MGKRNNRKRYPNHSRYVKTNVIKPSNFYEERWKQPVWVRYRFPFILIAIALAGLYLASIYNPKPKAIQEITSLDGTLSEEEKKGLQSLFPDGYQLIKVEEKKIISSELASGTSAFHVNWNYAKVYHFKEAQIILHLPNLVFEPAGLSLTVDLSFLRSTNAPTSMLQSQGYDLVIKVIQDHGDYLLCALGFRRMNGKTR